MGYSSPRAGRGGSFYFTKKTGEEIFAGKGKLFKSPNGLGR